MSYLQLKRYTMSFFSKTGITTLVIAGTIMAFTACHRLNGDSTVVDSDVANAASDKSQLEQANTDAENISDNAYSSGSAFLRSGSLTELGGCVTVTNDTTVTPHVLTIDFGSGCIGTDGRLRSGKIIVAYSGHYKDSASSHTISFSNYYVDSNRLSGYKTVTNMGRNSSGQYYYDISISDTIFITGTSNYISSNSTRTRIWTNGYSTATRMDDEYDIYGTDTLYRSATGKTVYASTSASDPLHVAVNCRWIESGTLTITLPSGTRYINFGSGTCDRMATYTVGTHTYYITLR